MTDNIEQLIARAELALCYASVDEVIATLIESGVEAGEAYLAVMAATVNPAVP